MNMEVPGTYTFQSELTLDDMLPILNAAGPWKWQFRDSDTKGFYLVADTGPDLPSVRIFEDPSPYIIHIRRWPDGPPALSRAALRDLLVDQLLPAVHARHVRAASQDLVPE